MAERERSSGSRRPSAARSGGSRGSTRKTATKKGSSKKTTSKKATPSKASSKKTTSEKRGSKKTATAPSSASSSTSRSTGQQSSRQSNRDRTGSATRIATAAAQQLLELTGKESEGVVAISKDGDSWMVEVEVLELRRIPNTTDVLASYEVTVDTSGDLVGYKRLRRYTRGSAGDE